MITFYLMTNPGDRENNEDNIGMYKAGEDYCFVLADGLGGHGAGEVASETAVEQVVAAFAENTADVAAFNIYILADNFFTRFYCQLVAYTKFLEVAVIKNFLRQTFESIIKIGKIMNVIIKINVQSADCDWSFAAKAFRHKKLRKF